MAKNSSVFLGTELKLNIHIEPLDGLTMDNYDFNVDVYVSQRKMVSAKKEQCVRVDENNYIVLVDTTVIGAGDVTVKVVAQIPDSDFEDGLRTEVMQIQTGITIAR